MAPYSSRTPNRSRTLGGAGSRRPSIGAHPSSRPSSGSTDEWSLLINEFGEGVELELPSGSWCVGKGVAGALHGHSLACTS